MRRLSLYISGKIAFTLLGPHGRKLRAEKRRQIGKRDEVSDTQDGFVIPHRQLRISGGKIGPLLRNRASFAVVKAQQEALSVPIVARGDEDAGAIAIRMKGVGHQYKLMRWIDAVCISA
jgi:hypothetical protein